MPFPPDSINAANPGRRSGPPRGGRADDDARRLRDVLRCDIFSGAFPDGQLPGEGDLMISHRARRAAVRDALSMLRSEGVVERVQGLGTFAVRERYTTGLRELHGVEHDDTGMIGAQRRPEVIDRSVIPAPDLVARKLLLDPGEHVLRLDYVAYVEDEPVGMATNYMAFPEAERVMDTRFDSDFYALLRDADVVLGGSEWLLSCVNADAAVARRLRVAPGMALMVGEELCWDEDGRPFDFAVCYVRADQFAFVSSAWSVTARNGGGTIARSDGAHVRQAAG